MNERETLKTFFSACVEDYEEQIVPAFQVLADAVVEFASPKSEDSVVDVGTGTGILARLMAPRVRKVIGIDFSNRMIEEANRASRIANLPNIEFVVADVEEMPFDSQSFSMVASSFGLNALATSKVFTEAYRVLAAGGRFVFQEWAAGNMHPFDQIIESVMSKYGKKATTEPKVLITREAMTLMNRWSAMFPTIEHYHRTLKNSGFASVDIECDRSVKCVLTVEAFLAYKMAWTQNAIELAQLSTERRVACMEELRSRLIRDANTSGELGYDPALVRVCATK